MPGKKTKTKNSQQTTNTLSPYTRRMLDQGRANVRRIQSENPFQAFEGQRVAGLSDLEGQARDGFMANQGVGQGMMGLAAEQAMQAGGYRPEQVNAGSFLDADVGAYMNPHLEAVRDANASRIQAQGREAQAAMRDDMVTSGAWGGSRSGIAQAETAERFGRMEAEMDARLRSDAFDSAAGLATADLNRSFQADQANAQLGLAGAQLGLQGAGLLGQLGGQFDESNRANAGMLSAFGAQERGIDQAGLDAAYQDFLRAEEDPWRRIQLEQSLMGLVPQVINSQSNGTQTTTSSPGLMGWGGFGLQAGATLFSSRLLKSDIEPIGERGGVKWYNYRYKWDAPSTVREGVIAEEVQETHPEAVHRDAATGYLKVDYSALPG